MAWTAPATQTTGTLITATTWNAQITDNMAYLGGLLVGGSALSSFGVGGEISLLARRVSVDARAGGYTHTNWNTLTSTVGFLASTGVQNAEVSFRILLMTGTYTLRLVHYRDPNVGIYTISIAPDGDSLVSIGTIDGYNGTTQNFIQSEITGITISENNYHQLNLKMATKNGAAAAYTGAIHSVTLFRTGA